MNQGNINCPKCNKPLHPGERYCRDCGIDAGEPPAGGFTSAGGPSPIKVRVIKQAGGKAPNAGQGAPLRIPQQGTCFYHRQQIATHICGRCGRSICRDCAKNYNGIFFCVECAAHMPPPPPVYSGGYPQNPSGHRGGNPQYSQGGPDAYSHAGAKSTNGWAIAALITGIFGWVPLAFIFGMVAIGQINNSGGRQTGKGLAVAAMLISVFVIVIAFLYGFALGFNNL